MRWQVLLAAISVGLAGCGGNDRSAEEVAAEANLLDPATVNAILGADLPPEGLSPANDIDANAAENGAETENAAVTENGPAAAGNQAD